MQAVILAAGVGSRLSSASGGSSKALVDIGGKPLILRQLEALADHGIGPVMVIGGHHADLVQRAIGDRAGLILNERFTETNSLYSLWLARDWIKGPFVLLNCDLLFDPRILSDLLEQPGNVLAYDSTSSRGPEQTKVAMKRDRVVDIGKDLPPNSARGESLGLLKFEADGSRALMAAADRLISDGNEGAWVIEATRAICAEVELRGRNVAGHAWTEIDLPHDLDVARREVWPVIWKGRWARQAYWRRTRRVGIGLIALGLAVAGWLTSTRVGPASIDWETVDAVGVEPLRISRDGKTQRWWDAPAGTVVVAQVPGPEAAIEVRLVLPPTVQPTDSHQYVVGVQVDGAPHDWYSLTATPDSGVSLGGLPVGDRDRITLVLPAGDHRIGVELTAGHSSRMLVRIRQPGVRED